MAKSRPAQSVLCIFVAALLLLPSISTHAQQSISVKAVLEDASTAEPVGFATVSLTPEGKSAPSRYVLSTADGAVNLTKVAKGKYTLKVELMGYRTLEKKLEVTSSVDFGKLKIEQDVEVLEAATIDGATTWQRIRHILFPLVSPTTFMLLILNTINVMKMFTVINMLTDGGPAKSTQNLVIMLQDYAFNRFQIGYASAISNILFVLILVIHIFQRKLEKKVQYDS